MADERVRIDPEDVLPERVDQRWLDREAEVVALRADVDALKADCLQMDALTDERDALRAEVERLKREVAHKDEILCAKNRALDALHYVWCSGGCETGAHRYDGQGSGALTEEVVREAIRQVDRMIACFGARIGRKQWQDLDELKQERFLEDTRRVARAEAEVERLTRELAEEKARWKRAFDRKEEEEERAEYCKDRAEHWMRQAEEQRQRAERAEALLALAKNELSAIMAWLRYEQHSQDELPVTRRRYVFQEGSVVWDVLHSLDAALAAYESREEP